MTYLRKALSLGPIRFNWPKGGIGILAGVKGARIAVDTTGKPDVAGGRYGLYFRKRLGTSAPARGVLSRLQ